MLPYIRQNIHKRKLSPLQEKHLSLEKFRRLAVTIPSFQQNNEYALLACKHTQENSCRAAKNPRKQRKFFPQMFCHAWYTDS